MNKTKIEWTQFTWNPITGCSHGCWYCYAKKLYRRFPALGNPNFVPKFFPERLKELSKLKKPSLIFVCSVADLFAEWTAPEWREAVLAKMRWHPPHTYQLLTKSPEGIPKGANFGDNVWVGVTVSQESELKNIKVLAERYAGHKFVSFEPLLFSPQNAPGWPCLTGFPDMEWCIIGKLTGSKKIPLDQNAVSFLLREARGEKIPVFIKNNVNWKPKIQEFPQGMKKLEVVVNG